MEMKIAAIIILIVQRQGSFNKLNNNYNGSEEFRNFLRKHFLTS